MVTLSELRDPADKFSSAVQWCGVERKGGEQDDSWDWDGQFSEWRPCVPVWLVLTVLCTEVCTEVCTVQPDCFHQISLLDNWSGRACRAPWPFSPNTGKVLFSASAQFSSAQTTVGPSDFPSCWWRGQGGQGRQWDVWQMFAVRRSEMMTSVGAPSCPVLPSPGLAHSGLMLSDTWWASSALFCSLSAAPSCHSYF